MNKFDNNSAFLGKSNQREESYSISISFEKKCMSVIFGDSHKIHYYIQSL